MNNATDAQQLGQSISVKYDGTQFVLSAVFNGSNVAQIILEPRIADALVKFIKENGD